MRETNYINLPIELKEKFQVKLYNKTITFQPHKNPDYIKTLLKLANSPRMLIIIRQDELERLQKKSNEIHKIHEITDEIKRVSKIENPSLYDQKDGSLVFYDAPDSDENIKQQPSTEVKSPTFKKVKSIYSNVLEHKTTEKKVRDNGYSKRHSQIKQLGKDSLPHFGVSKTPKKRPKTPPKDIDQVTPKKKPSAPKSPNSKVKITQKERDAKRAQPNLKTSIKKLDKEIALEREYDDGPNKHIEVTHKLYVDGEIENKDYYYQHLVDRLKKEKTDATIKQFKSFNSYNKDIDKYEQDLNIIEQVEHEEVDNFLKIIEKKPQNLSDSNNIIKSGKNSQNNSIMSNPNAEDYGYIDTDLTGALGEYKDIRKQKIIGVERRETLKCDDAFQRLSQRLNDQQNSQEQKMNLMLQQEIERKERNRIDKEKIKEYQKDLKTKIEQSELKKKEIERLNLEKARLEVQIKQEEEEKRLREIARKEKEALDLLNLRRREEEIIQKLMRQKAEETERRIDEQTKKLKNRLDNLQNVEEGLNQAKIDHVKELENLDKNLGLNGTETESLGKNQKDVVKLADKDFEKKVSGDTWDKSSENISYSMKDRANDRDIQNILRRIDESSRKIEYINKKEVNNEVESDDEGESDNKGEVENADADIEKNGDGADVVDYNQVYDDEGESPTMMRAKEEPQQPYEQPSDNVTGEDFDRQVEDDNKSINSAQVVYVKMQNGKPKLRASLLEENQRKPRTSRSSNRRSSQEKIVEIQQKDTQDQDRQIGNDKTSSSNLQNPGSHRKPPQAPFAVNGIFFLYKTKRTGIRG